MVVRLGNARARSLWAVTGILAIAVTMVGLPAAGQTPMSDVSLAALAADEPFTVDGDDRLYATINNREPVAVTGAVDFYHPDASTSANRFATVDVDVPANANRTVSLVWDGRIFGAPLADEHPIHAKLTLDGRPAAIDSHRTINVTFLHHAVDIAAAAPADDAILPGATATQTIHVTNTGNRADNVTLSVADATPGWTFYVDPIEVADVAPGATRTATLTVAAPRDAAADATGTANVTARATELLSAADTTKTAAFQVAPLVDFTLTATPADQDVAAGDTLTFTVTAANTGNQPVDLTLAAPESLDLDEHTLSLEPGAHEDVTASADTPDGILAATYLADVTATDAATGIERHAWATAHVAPEPAYQVVGPGDGPITLEIAPAATAIVVAGVENQGNHWDRYAVTLDDVPDDWSFHPAEQTLVVPPGLIAEAEFKLTVPAGTAADTYTLTAVAQPVDDAASSSPETLPVAVTVPEDVIPSLTVQASPLPIDASGPTDFTVTIRNVGNTAGDVTLAEPTLESAEPDDPAWDAQWQGGDTTFTLEPGTSEQRTVRVTAPGGLEASAEAVFTLEATTTGDGAATATIIAQTAAPDLTVDQIATSAAIHAGQPTSLVVHVANVGTDEIEDSVTVRVNATRDAVEVFTHDVELADGLGWQAGENAAVLDIPWTPADEGDHVITATIDPDDTVAEKHGDGDDPTGNNNATVDAFVRLEDLVLVAPPASAATPGQRTLLTGSDTFELRNLGNVDEYVRVTGASAPEGWNVTPIGTSPVVLTPGQTFEIDIVVDAPAMPGPDQAPIQLHVASDGGDLSGVVLLAVADASAPVIEHVTVTPASGLLGQPLVVSANVTDDTDVAWAAATFTAADGVQSRIALAPDAQEPGRWAGTLVPKTPGAYRAHLVAADAADPPHVASTQTAPLAFEVVVDPTPPLIQFLSPSTDGGPVKGASGLNFTVADPYGVANVTYVVRAPGDATDVLVNQTVGPSQRYRVPLDGLPEETLMVHVRAENVFGVAADANRTFRIDNTPPQILDVTYLADGAGGFDVTAEVAAAADVSGVEVRLRLVDGSLERVAMENTTRPDRYVAHVPGLNLTAWWVAAWDHVGNAAVEEFAPPGGPAADADGGSSPGLAAPLVAAAVAVAAAAIRRRRGR